MATTTWDLIRKQFVGSTTQRGVLETLTPSLVADKPFRRVPRRNVSLRKWAQGSSVEFRAYEWRREGDVGEPEVFAGEILRRETGVLTVAYPIKGGLAIYGDEDLDAVEALIRSDARQLRDALLSPGNVISGLHGIRPTIASLDRADDAVWFQDIVCEVIYQEAEALT